MRKVFAAFHLEKLTFIQSQELLFNQKPQVICTNVPAVDKDEEQNTAPLTEITLQKQVPACGMKISEVSTFHQRLRCFKDEICLLQVAGRNMVSLTLYLPSPNYFQIHKDA